MNEESTLKCDFCGKSINTNEIALAFNDGVMCNDCAEKYNLLYSDGFPTNEAMNYASSHSVADFKKQLQSKQNRNKIPAAICALCHKPTRNYLIFVADSVVGEKCGIKYGMFKNGAFTDDAKKYAHTHTLSELKNILEEFGEFPTQIAMLNKKREESNEIENKSFRKNRQYQPRKKNQLHRTQHTQFDEEKTQDIRKHHSFFYYIGVIVVVIFCFNFIRGFIGGFSDGYNSATSSSVSHETKKYGSQNLPGQKINSSKATKHEFYWTSKDDKNVRYFVDDSKKITAIKVVLAPKVNNTWWCQSYMGNVLHDSKLRFSNDKQKQGNIVLANNKSYNIYSPKHRKWYWVRFDAADNVGKKDHMVASFAIYPNKSSEAE